MLYLHIGLHKTGTTYFQGEVFPHWPGVRYLRSLSVESFLKIDPEQTCLVSREGLSGGVVAHQQEKLDFLKRLSIMFPDARILISLRQHGPYLNAIYSQFLRYGGTLTFEEFFDQDNDNGYIKRADLLFQSYIDGISSFWGRPPFVFVLEELKENRQRLFNDLGAFLGVQPPDLESKLSSKRKNVSLGKTQAAVLRRVNQMSGVALHRDGSTRPYRLMRRFGIDPPRLCQRWSALGKALPIVDQKTTEQINHLFADDWRYVRSCTTSRIPQDT